MVAGSRCREEREKRRQRTPAASPLPPSRSLPPLLTSLQSPTHRERESARARERARESRERESREATSRERGERRGGSENPFPHTGQRPPAAANSTHAQHPPAPPRAPPPRRAQRHGGVETSAAPEREARGEAERALCTTASPATPPPRPPSHPTAAHPHPTATLPRGPPCRRAPCGGEIGAATNLEKTYARRRCTRAVCRWTRGWRR